MLLIFTLGTPLCHVAVSVRPSVNTRIRRRHHRCDISRGYSRKAWPEAAAFSSRMGHGSRPRPGCAWGFIEKATAMVRINSHMLVLPPSHELLNRSNTTSTLLTQLDHTILSVQSSQTAQTMALENHNIIQQKTFNDVQQSLSSHSPLKSRRTYTVPPIYSTSEDRMDVDDPLTSSTLGDGARKKKWVLNYFPYDWTVTSSRRAGQEGSQKGVRKRNRFWNS